MNSSIKQILMLAAAASAVHAIEPPVESQPVPPQARPAARPEAPAKIEAEAVPPRAMPVPVPMPQVEAVAERPCLGVILDPVPEILAGHLRLNPGEGLVINDVITGGPAEVAGLTPDDLLTKVDGEIVGTPDQVRARVETHRVGDPVKLEVIHAGERRELEVVLGAMPRAVGPGLAMGGNDLDGLLEGLPEKHADLLREAFERNMRHFEELEREAGLQDDFLRRWKQRVRGQGIQFDFNQESSITLEDEEGRIELKGDEGHTEARVFDKAGNVVWEGPYDTEQDKAAVPDDIRGRLDRLNVDMRFGGNGLRLFLGPNRFRPLDQIDPPAPVEPEPGPGE